MKIVKVVLTLFFCTTYLACAQDKPNVLLIITDDQGWGDVAFHNNTDIDTPFLNDLASKSVQFKRFYVSPVCAPTRASVLTGKYHLNTGVSWVTHRKEVMRNDEHTLAELLGEQGYNTGLFGKWHNGKQYPHDPIGQGFSTFFGFSEGHLNNYYDTDVQSQHQKVSTKGYFPDVMTQKAIDFMRTSKDPFFCYVAFNTPHGPFQVDDTLFNKYANKGFDNKTAAVYGMVENLDQNIGKLLNTLKELDQLNNTIIIFMTDNGPNGIRYNGGFKGKKAEVDEGGVRVPFLLRYDAAKWTRKAVHDMAAHIDIYPTIASLCGIDISDKSTIDGINLSPLLSNKATTITDRKIYTHQVIRDIDTIPGAVRTNQYLLTIKKSELALFDMNKDPFQKNDISQDNLLLVDSLKNAYNTWFNKSNILSQSMIPIQVGHHNIPYVEFPAPDALSYTNTKFMGGYGWAHDYFTNFENESVIHWKIKTVKPARYDIYAEIETNGKKAVDFMIRVSQDTLKTLIDKKYVAKQIQSPDRHPRGGVFEWKWEKVKLGTLVFNETDDQLIIDISNGKSGGLKLKSIELHLTD